MTDKAIIVGVNIMGTTEDISQEMCELRSLCEACEIAVVSEVIQNLPSINPTTYVGKGKLEEIKTLIASLETNIVVFNDELTPSQIRTLEKFLEITIYDRTYIILEIFRRRARTKEAILQVEMATLNYLLPRLVGMREGLSRQRGIGSSSQHGRGGGETKLELDRRYIQKRISQIRSELKKLTSLRAVQRNLRKKRDIPVVSIVGYTNSGKSTLLNALLSYSIEDKKEVFEKDMLFATLETATRKIKLPNQPEFLLTDTVGFVQKLPHHLVEAFKSTLEEITESDLILHVVDSSNERYPNQIKVTNQVLNEIGVKNIPVIYCFNKIDLIPEHFYVEPQYEQAIKISAKTKENLAELLNLIIEKIFPNHEVCTFLIPFNKGNLLEIIMKHNEVISTSFTNNETLITAKVPSYFKNKYFEYLQN